jgi:hypothetical protein
MLNAYNQFSNYTLLPFTVAMCCPVVWKVHITQFLIVGLSFHHCKSSISKLIAECSQETPPPHHPATSVGSMYENKIQQANNVFHTVFLLKSTEHTTY